MQGERSALSLQDWMGAVLFGVTLDLPDFGHEKRRPWTSFLCGGGSLRGLRGVIFQAGYQELFLRRGPLDKRFSRRLAAGRGW